MKIAVIKNVTEQVGMDTWETRKIVKIFDSFEPIQSMIDWANGTSKNKVIPDMGIVDETEAN